jgi:hypothetical protein
VEQFGIAETPDDGRLRPKLVVKGRSDRNNCIIDGIILCIQDPSGTNSAQKLVVNFRTARLLVYPGLLGEWAELPSVQKSSSRLKGRS